MSRTASRGALLPEPGPEDAADSAALRARIRRACEAAGGSLGFDAYMELALYAPGLGYYSAPRSRFGPDGDFVTAPEISPLFGRCLARQAAQVLTELGGGRVLEAGAGSGVMARDVLAALDALGVTDVEYLILERSASARAWQRERLHAYAARVRWLDDFPRPGFRGVVLANELLDALPVMRFVVAGTGVEELAVVPRGEGFAWQARPANGARAAMLEGMLAGLEPLPGGYVSEFGPARAAWVQELGERLQHGVVLIVDYGYPRRELYHPQRHGGTLACHYRHRLHDDPFWHPGLQDISAHVDFTAVAEAGVAAGLELAGFTTQSHFLLATGLLEGLDEAALDSRSRAELTLQIRRLTLPGEMGEAVKVMALSRGVAHPLVGFVGRDLGHRL